MPTLGLKGELEPAFDGLAFVPPLEGNPTEPQRRQRDYFMFFRRFRTFTKRLNGLVKQIAELCSPGAEIVVPDVRRTWPNFVTKGESGRTIIAATRYLLCE